MEERLRLTDEQQYWLQVMTEAYGKFKDAGGCMVIHTDTEDCFAFNGQQVESIDYLDEEDVLEKGLEVMDDKMDGLQEFTPWIPLWDYTRSLCMKFKSNQ